MRPLTLGRDPQRPGRGASGPVRYFTVPCNVCLILLAAATLGLSLVLVLSNCTCGGAGADPGPGQPQGGRDGTGADRCPAAPPGSGLRAPGLGASSCPDGRLAHPGPWGGICGLWPPRSLARSRAHPCHRPARLAGVSHLLCPALPCPAGPRRGLGQGLTRDVFSCRQAWQSLHTGTSEPFGR